MHLPSFDYRSARTVEEAVALHAGAAGAAYMAGATDLLPQARTGRRTLARVIDVKTIPALRAFADDQGGLRIGAAVPLSDVAADPRVRERWPLLAQCCLAVGAWPLRNRATLAGNVCNASPAADTAVALLALDAIVVAEGPDGSRELPIDGFFVGPGRSALAPGELVTAIRLTAASAGLKGSYLRLSRRKGLDLATVGVLVGRRGVSGSANGSANGGANGGANGSANGGGNGSASGSANGGGNGSANGSANG
ncbi:MAG: FAD binding domain-containing protein, partial [Deltaproteobacteria bacterium]|nr:FAD binding domain-containing protein [Deltaproteobacteria bacterium]